MIQFSIHVANNVSLTGQGIKLYLVSIANKDYYRSCCTAPVNYLNLVKDQANNMKWIVPAKTWKEDAGEGFHKQLWNSAG